MKIRSGGYLREDGTFAEEFYEILAEYERKLETATRQSVLPDQPDMEKVEAFVEHVNRRPLEQDGIL